MKEKILIVEDEFIVANDLKITLTKAGYDVCGIASSVVQARQLIASKTPNWVLLDIILKGDLNGIDLAWELVEQKIPFLYISANTNNAILEAVKETRPYGFLVKPFRENDLLVMLDIARYKYNIEVENNAKISASSSSKDVNQIDGIIGKSEKLVDLIQKIALVAPTETSVLITGESGTGKEKIAHAIHDQSAHKSKPLIVVNCGALPESLIESELFGHEKGAFTGANTTRIGKFEQANGGTIFLDEIGELPLDSQVKLLRVLQEREIERLGSTKTIKLDVRIIAATNRCLQLEVAEGRFRLDLYYRLNVFPLELPALRDRKEDIEALAYYFLEKYALKARRTITKIAEKGIQQLLQYNWPGNIRELEHVMERHVLLATTTEIKEFDLPKSTPTVTKEIQNNNNTLLSMEEMEREHIMNALKASSGRVFGPGGAAELLKIPASTLYSKMKKLNIQQGYF